MSYADTSLDLTAVRVACLSGQNGAGKSALLDAITWALWERARAGSDELIRIGEGEMWVDMVFTYEGRTYRIRRSRQKRLSKKGGKATTKGTLEFQVLVDDEAQAASSGVSPAPLAEGLSVNQVVASRPALKAGEGRWKSLTAGSMRATQQVINDLLRMEYDTFINSAYLRQGRADEFTTRAPNERKQVLSEILGLSYFERLKESCRASARESRGKIELLEEIVKELPQQEESMAVLNESLLESSKELASIDLEKESLESVLKERQERYQSLLLASEKKAVNQEKVEELEADLKELSARELRLKNRLEELSKLIENSSHIEEQSQKFAEIRGLTEALDRKSLAVQELTEEKHELKARLATMRSRLEVEADHVSTRLKETREKIEKLESDTADRAKVENMYREYLELLERESQASNKQETFSQLNKRATELQAAVTEARIKLEAEVAQRSNHLKELADILAAESTLSNRKSELEEESQEMDRLEAELELVETRGLEAKSEIEVLEQKIVDLKRRKLENEEKVRELHDHDHSSICPLCSAPIVDRAKVIGRYQIQNQGFEQEMLEVGEEIKMVEEKRADLRNEYKRLRKHLEGRKDLDKRIGQFNEKSNSIVRARTSFDTLEKELKEMERRLEEGDYSQVEKESLVGLKAEIHKLDFDPVLHSSLQSQIRMKRHVETRKQSLDRDLSELERLRESLPALIEKEAEYRDQLDSESYGVEVRQALEKLNEKLLSMDYDRSRHLELKKELAELLPFAERLNELAKAKEEKPELEIECRSLEQKRSGKLEKIEQLKEESAVLTEDSVRLPELAAEVKVKEEELTALLTRRDKNTSAVAVLESQIGDLDRSMQSLKEKQKELLQLKTEREDYLLLAEAFGKKGIQAIIIENSIPEIESEANRILSRLTDNKMHIALITQHQTKSGSMTETLDILIGDEVGTRNYELYSGGESFKVNFSIRIALSRLLARRAGARLETLIIDEGFGSQDNRSRERLVRSIKAIQSDFSRILVITHFLDVQEMFPTQIQVKKEEGISKLQIVS